MEEEKRVRKGNITGDFAEKKVKNILISHLIPPPLQPKTKEPVPFFNRMLMYLLATNTCENIHKSADF